MKNIKKLKGYDFLFIVLAIFVIIVSIIIPKSGKFALLDEAFDISFFWIATIYITIKLITIGIHIDLKTKFLRIFIIVLFVGFSCFTTKNLILDMLVGSKTITLEKVQTSEYMNSSGFASKHYHLKGTDQNGNRIRLEISSDDYYSFKNTNRVVVEYFENTKRVLSIKK